ncbi:hypothetical protein [Breznakiella homolactica]|uniref:Uncharacterized protein n=1 Tax=Breznakiella homolactica TaxID=2798577 RepID=A0A7T7XNN6_9SPIR|nr:hypothetical protein [Breznakiella homolactica]QQO09671.1 hypothetical protein JFL75_01765 [Breznakiella homolactica]
MEVYRPFRFALFVYDLFRLVFVVCMVAFFSPSMGDPGSRIMPYIFFAAPNALFPLMSLFIWASLARYASYLPLYLAGKLIGIGSFIAWLGFSFNNILVSLPMNAVSGLMILGLTLLLCLADIGTILGVSLLLRRIGPRQTEEGRLQARESSEEPAGEPDNGGF